MFKQAVVGVCALFMLANAQHKGEMTPEETPPMTYETCTTDGGCAVQQGGITMDGNWRWTHIAAVSNLFTQLFFYVLCKFFLSN